MADLVKIIIAGTGKISKEFELYLNDNVEVIGYVETTPNKQLHKGLPVYSYNQLLEKEYDYLIVANRYTTEIKKTLHIIGIDERKIIYLRPFFDCEVSDIVRITGMNMLKNIAPNYVNNLLSNRIEYKSYCVGQKMFVDTIEDSILDQYKLQKATDYVRFRTFELVAEQINDLSGNVAEVGVFQGDFAQLINAAFPDRKCYLFDTFESFDKEEFAEEVIAGNCKEQFYNEFKDTSVEEVIKRMTYPENCVVRKGLFPKTAENLEDTFIFVSIDVDFEKSIYDCLSWFYPRMAEGGVMFIHDYNNFFLFGVKKAVEKYEAEHGRLHKIPLADTGGTLMIIK